MTIAATTALAARRRDRSKGGAAASAPDGSSAANQLAATVPAEVITLYSAVIAGCESAAGPNSYTTFRVIVYVVGLLATLVTAGRAVHAVVGHVLRALRSAEVQAAVVAFAAWGLVLPGSFLYAHLHKPVLSLTIVSVTASATFVLAVFYGPQLTHPTADPGGAPTGPPLTTTPPGG